MHLVKRLRNRETTNIRQEFVYTQEMLKTLAQEPKIVVPVSRQAVTELELLKRTISVFFVRQNLRASSAYQKVWLFNMHDTEVLHYKCYGLLYTSQRKKLDLPFNLLHKIQFTHDLLLQAGTTIHWEEKNTQASEAKFGSSIRKPIFHVINLFTSKNWIINSSHDIADAVTYLRQYLLYSRHYI